MVIYRVPETNARVALLGLYSGVREFS